MCKGGNWFSCRLPKDRNKDNKLKSDHEEHKLDTRIFPSATVSNYWVELMEEMKDFFSLHFFLKHRCIFLFFGMTLVFWKIYRQSHFFPIFLSPWPSFHLKNDKLYISTSNFYFTEAVIIHLPNFFFYFCPLSIRYSFLSSCLLVLPFTLEQTCIPKVSPLICTWKDIFKKWWNWNQSNFLHGSK